MSQDAIVSKRLVSLDAFRGFTIISMLMVNNTGYDSAFPDQFRHGHWGEFVTFCDQIFPWFLFMVGVALPFSAASFKRKNPEFIPYFWKVFRRTFLLMFLGDILESTLQKRIVIGFGWLNVLQLIALAYFVGALIYELPKKWRWGIAGFFLFLNWFVIRFVPIPGVGAGFFEEDKNIIEYLNHVLSPYHLAGTLSVIPTTALVLIGTYFGDLLREESISSNKKMKTLGVGGLVLVILGLLWHLDLPMNKALWTASYILFTAGTGCLVLLLFYYIMDFKGFQKLGFPFMVYGMNAITAYFFSIFVREHTVKEWYTKSATGEKITLWQALLDFWTHLAGINLGSWLFTFSYIAFWWIVLYWMYRKKLFLRV